MEKLIFASATELVYALQTKAVSSQEVVTALLQRIDAINPRLNAVVQLAPDALTHAQQADADLARGVSHGPLHGLPFTVKDTFGTAGLISAIDTRIRRRKAPSRDCTVVERLRKAGAILLGKTNCPPNGSGSDTENAIHGRTLNPYQLTHTPGGSSGGEAALIAVGGSPIGLGSDVRGGLRVPAHYCGIAAIRPTTGRVPNTGVYNQPGGFSDLRSQIGVLARRVDDLALLLPIIAGPDDQDAGVAPVPWRDPAAVPPHDLQIAYFTHDPTAPVTPETDRAVGGAAQALARAGVAVTALRPPGLIADSRGLDDFWQDMAGSPGRTVVEFIAQWDGLRSRMLQFMAHYDALLCPVDHHPAPPFQERDPKRFAYTNPFSLTGYPCVVVRVGTDPKGLPIGVQLVARPWREEVALALARLLEQEFGGWHQPPLTAMPQR